MSKNLNQMTTVNQSTFLMPNYGRAFGTPACAIWPIDVPVRDRHVAASLKGAFPGTSVWRPPNC